MTDDEDKKLKPLPMPPVWVEDKFVPSRVIDREHADIVGISRRLEQLANRTDDGFERLTTELSALSKSLLPAIDRVAESVKMLTDDVKTLTDELRMTQAEVGVLKRSDLDTKDRLRALERSINLPRAQTVTRRKPAARKSR